jgi:hypothetical protein
MKPRSRPRPGHRMALTRSLRRWLVVPFCIACLIRLATIQIRAFDSDADGDGIDDGLELTLATQAFPTVYRQYDDDCPGPIPHPTLFRARYPTVGGVPDTNYIVINYVILYDADCGWIDGAGGHPGDDEAFQVWLVTDGTNWYFGLLSAHQHWDALCEGVDQSGSDELWIGGDKHSNYADPADCGCWGTDTCDVTNQEGYPVYTLYNVGEPTPQFQLITQASQVDGSWPGGIWDGSTFDYGPGIISRQLFISGFPAFAPPQPPPDTECLDNCDQTHQACYCCESLDQCDSEYASCESSCSTSVWWDEGS